MSERVTDVLVTTSRPRSYGASVWSWHPAAKGGESIEVEVRPILRKLYDAVASGFGPQQPVPDRRRARSV